MSEENERRGILEQREHSHETSEGNDWNAGLTGSNGATVIAKAEIASIGSTTNNVRNSGTVGEGSKYMDVVYF